MPRSDEADVAKALRAYNAGQYSSLRAAAKAYKVSPATVTRRARGMRSKADTPAANKALTSDEEDLVVQKVLSLHSRGKLPTQHDIRTWASTITTARGAEEVGVRWASNFVKRHPEARTRPSRKSAQRANAAASTADPASRPSHRQPAQRANAASAVHTQDLIGKLSEGLLKQQATMTLMQNELAEMQQILVELQSHCARRSRVRPAVGIDNEALTDRDHPITPAAPVTDLPDPIEKRPKSPACRKCGIAGHNSRSCPINRMPSELSLDPMFRQTNMDWQG